jgi:hypothetical protein
VAFLVEGVLIGLFAGLVLRPFLDAYVLWHGSRRLDEEARRAQAEDHEVPHG